MNRPLLHELIAALALVAALTAAPGVHAREPDWQAYDQLLENYVSSGEREGIRLNLVDYSRLGGDPEFAGLLNQLARFPLDTLEGPDEELAFYINAYNILAISVVVKNQPLESIKDVGSWLNPVWKHTAGVLDGREFTLDEIEHEVLRKMGEPRIHFAIVCASLSCPDLRTEAYRADRLDSQLNEQTRRFIQNPAKGVSKSAEGLRVSRIFDWFSEDFEAAGVEGFIQQFRQSTDGSRISGYLPYRWQLNGY